METTRLEAIDTDNKGNLLVRRLGNDMYDEMICPYSTGGVKEKNCGKWCPLFGDFHIEPNEQDEDMLYLSLCKKTLMCKAKHN